MKKVILTSGLYYPNTGGIESSLKYLAKAGLKKNDDITIVTSNIVEGDSYLEPGDTIEDGISVSRYQVPDYGSRFFRKIKYLCNAVFTYKRIVKKNSIVISRYHWNVILCFLGGGRDIRYLVPGVVRYQYNSDNLASSKNKISLFFEDKIQYIALKLSSQIYVFSKNMEEQILSISPNFNVIHVSPGSDLQRFNRNVNKDNNKIKLLIVSRLVKAKGIEYAVNALEYLDERYVLDIVGDGHDMQMLKNIAAEKNLMHRVFFHGKKNNPEFYYADADIFLLPSLYEPFGQTIIEASTAGIPTVAFDSDITGIQTATKDILGDMGFYSKEINAESYASVIRSIKHEQLNEIGKKLRHFVCEKYSWDSLYNTLTS